MRIDDVLRGHGIGSGGLRRGTLIPLNRIKGADGVDSVMLREVTFDGTNSLSVMKRMRDGNVCITSRYRVRKIDEWGDLIWQLGLSSWGFSIHENPITDNIYVSTNGVLMCVSPNGQFITNISIPSHTYHTIDSEGNVYISYDGSGVRKYVPTNDQQTNYSLVWTRGTGSNAPGYELALGLNESFIFAPTRSTGLFKINTDNGTSTSYTGGWLNVNFSIFNGMFYDNRNDVIFMVSTQGVVRIDAETFTPINSLSQSGVSGIRFSEKENVFYMMDSANGLTKRDNDFNIIETLMADVVTNFNIMTVIEDNSVLHHSANGGTHRLTAWQLTIN